MNSHFILYVQDQIRSTEFYQKVLCVEPRLNVPGMTEIELGSESVLGIMPEKSIKRLLGNSITDPEQTNGISRAELYLYVENPEEYHKRALEFGARELSSLQARDWGDQAAYSMDMDGHILAFARREQ
ncbi:MAG: glyoxalase [Halobacteriovoraceae bacterium]|nr:glyoxalase [Halobacteriovoraceae bacterium]